MGRSFDIRMVVKHTFLEFVQFPSHGRRRSATVRAISEIEDSEEYANQGQCEHFIQHPWTSSSWSSTESEDESDSANASLRPFDCGSWSTVASADGNDGSDTAKEPNCEDLLLQENARLTRENEELRALKEKFRHQEGAAIHSQEHDVPSCCDRDIDALAPVQYTTVMLRNLPNMYSREMMMNLLNSEGFGGKFTFIYLPIDFKSNAGLGYAFVDMETHSEAERLRQHFEGFSRWVLPSEKVCSVSWSLLDQQGVSAQVERYRNSPVMHKSVPDEWKPVLLSGGKRILFPPPTRKIRAPRLRP